MRPDGTVDTAPPRIRQARVQYNSPLLNSLQTNLRLQHLSRRTEAAYVYWPSGSSASPASGIPLLFLYRNVLGRPLEALGRIPRGRVPSTLPVVLTPAEVALVLSQLAGTHRLTGLLLYGSGLRVTE